MWRCKGGWPIGCGLQLYKSLFTHLSGPFPGRTQRLPVDVLHLCLDLLTEKKAQRTWTSHLEAQGFRHNLQWERWHWLFWPGLKSGAYSLCYVVSVISESIERSVKIALQKNHISWKILLWPSLENKIYHRHPTKFQGKTLRGKSFLRVQAEGIAYTNIFREERELSASSKSEHLVLNYRGQENSAFTSNLEFGHKGPFNPEKELRPCPKGKGNSCRV